MKTYDRPITLYKVNEETEMYAKFTKCPMLHAAINKAREKDEFLSGGATRHQVRLTFEVHYIAALQEVFNNPQRFRILYDGVFYDIVDTDDYLLKHRILRFAGVSIDGRC